MLNRLLGRQNSLVEDALRDLSVMLKQSKKMYLLATAALLDNEQLTADLDALDDVVDQSERKLRRTILEHLSMNPKDDLVTCLSLISIVQDAERIGDFARGLGEIVALASAPRTGPYTDQLKRIAGEVEQLFDDTELAFSEDRTELAAQVVSTASSLKTELIALTANAANGTDLNVNEAVVYTGTARILRRVAAHLSNVCSTLTQPFDSIRHSDETA